MSKPFQLSRRDNMAICPACGKPGAIDFIVNQRPVTLCGSRVPEGERISIVHRAISGAVAMGWVKREMGQ